MHGLERRTGDSTGRRLYRNTALISSFLVLVAIGSTASAAAATSSNSTLGVSHTVTDTRQTAAIGAIFHGAVASSGDHYCTASVVRSPGRNLIVTAAHCLSGGTDDLYFVPGYHDGRAPYGIWRIGTVYRDARWDDDHDDDLDVAFAVVEPLSGHQVEDVVGGHPLRVNRGTGGTIRITGYPSDLDAPITCVNRVSAFTAHQMRIACTAYSSGTSGSPWLTRDGAVVGVIGGFEEGGDTDDVSYSSYFDSEVETLYQQAVAATA